MALNKAPLAFFVLTLFAQFLRVAFNSSAQFGRSNAVCGKITAGEVCRLLVNLPAVKGVQQDLGANAFICLILCRALLLSCRARYSAFRRLLAARYSGLLYVRVPLLQPRQVGFVTVIVTALDKVECAAHVKAECGLRLLPYAFSAVSIFAFKFM